MNEQVEKLARECGAWKQVYGNRNFMIDEHFDIEKFAELIVKECVEQLRYTVLDTQELRRDKSTDYQVGWEDGMFDAEEMIKQHFRS